MENATLSYYVNDSNYRVFSDMLFNIDKYTSSLKNEKELFETISHDNAFRVFLQENKAKGSFKIKYIDNKNKSHLIPVLYNERPVEIDDYYRDGIISESEYSRRSLLNSKEQLYSKLFLLNNAVDMAKKYSILISENEANILKRHGILTFNVSGSKAVSIEDLIRYRSSHSKLKDVRDIYVNALDLWKAKMDSLPYDEIYYLSREYRVINNYYNRIRQNGLSVSNLNINKHKLNSLKHHISLSTVSPFMEGNNRNKKNKIMNKYGYNN